VEQRRLVLFGEEQVLALVGPMLLARGLEVSAGSVVALSVGGGDHPVLFVAGALGRIRKVLAMLIKEEKIVIEAGGVRVEATNCDDAKLFALLDKARDIQIALARPAERRDEPPDKRPA
jgi:hypothetical protein